MAHTRLSEMMFLNQKAVDLYLDLPKACLNRCAVGQNYTFAHAHRLFMIWLKQGLVRRTKVGREYNIIYTVKGKRLADLLMQTKFHLKASGVQWGKYTMPGCDWCNNGQCKTSEDTCDFKTLKKSKEDIVVRMDAEHASIVDLFGKMKDMDSSIDVNYAMAQIKDKLSGIKIMSDVLEIEFQTKYVPKAGAIQMTKLVLDAKIRAEKLKRKQK